MHLKCMLQWMAASYAGVPNLIYYTFHHEELAQVKSLSFKLHNVAFLHGIIIML